MNDKFAFNCSSFRILQANALPENDVLITCDYPPFSQFYIKNHDNE